MCFDGWATKHALNDCHLRGCCIEAFSVRIGLVHWIEQRMSKSSAEAASIECAKLCSVRRGSPFLIKRQINSLSWDLPNLTVVLFPWEILKFVITELARFYWIEISQRFREKGLISYGISQHCLDWVSIRQKSYGQMLRILNQVSHFLKSGKKTKSNFPWEIWPNCRHLLTGFNCNLYLGFFQKVNFLLWEIVNFPVIFLTEFSLKFGNYPG